jgi:signal transduction histidine kinase
MTPTRRRLLAVGGAIAGIALGLRAADAWNPGVDVRLVVWDLAVGWAFIAGGLAAWAGRPSSGAGRLLVVVGVAWFAGTIWPPLEFLHRGVLFHLLATYPTGRLAVRAADAGGWLRLAAVVAVYAASLTRLGGDQLVTVAVAAGFLALGSSDVVQSNRALRRGRLTSSAMAIAVGVAMLAPLIARLMGTSLGITTLLAYDAVLAIGAIGLSVDLLAGRWSLGLLTSAVVDLGDAALAGSVRERLARSLGDPSLVVAYAVDEPPDTFVDEFGQPVTLPPPSPSRAVSPMVVAGRATGFIAHDPAVLDDPHIIGTLSAAAALAMSNSTMQADVRARVAEVDASRERLVHAADNQRRRLEGRLQAGAAKRLERVAALLAEVQPAPGGAEGESTVERLRADLERARSELSDLARGVHPATLTSAGLRAALAELVRRSPLPVDLAVDAEPADPLTEATLYFLCSEALTNASKHAAAATIAIHLRQAGGSLHLVVFDDGRGGARLASRGGLRGLADRVEALGGKFELESQAGAGTTIRVELPRRAAAAAGHP